MPTTITYQQVNAPMKFTITARDDGEVLAFKGAILARAETNLNRDQIDEEGIQELAKTIIGRAIDVEHDTTVNCGVFTAATPVDDSRALSVDGFVWADRYPNEAAGMQNGTHSLSVEATADEAMCSVCSKSFADASQYCSHLTMRGSTGAVRKLKHLRGKGGALTTHPAGTNTNFNPTSVYFIASHGEISASWYDSYLKKSGETLKDLPDTDFADPKGRRFPYKIHGKVIEEGWRAAFSAASGGHTGKSDEAALSVLKRNKPDGVKLKESQEESMKTNSKVKVKAEFTSPTGLAEQDDDKVQAGADDVIAPQSDDGADDVKPGGNTEEADADMTAVDDAGGDSTKSGCSDNSITRTDGAEGVTKNPEDLASLVSKMQEDMVGLKASVSSLKKDVSSITASLTKSRMEARRIVLKASFTDEEFESQKDVISAMDDKMFNLLISSLNKQTRQTTVGTMRVPDKSVEKKEPLTLRKS